MGDSKRNWFPHDSNARNSDKLIPLRAKMGAEGYGIYFMILERLREEPTYMSVKDYNMLAFDLRVDAAKIKAVVEGYGLFVFTDDGKYFYSGGFLKRMKSKDEISVKRRAAINKRWAKEAEGYKCNTNVSADEYKCNTNVIQEEKSIYNSLPNGRELSSSTSTIAGEELSIFGGSAPNSTPKSPKSQKSCAKKGTETAAAADVTIPIEQLEAAMQAETVWIEALCMNLHKSRDWIDGMIHEFCTEQKLNGATVKPLSDAKRHFRNYLRKAEERMNNEKRDERTQCGRGTGKAPRTSDLDFAKAVAEGIALANTPQEWEL